MSQLSMFSVSGTDSAKPSSKSTGQKPNIGEILPTLLPTPSTRDWKGAATKSRDTLDSAVEKGQTKLRTGLFSQADSRASHSVQQDEGAERQMTATSGQTCLRSYEIQNPTGSLLKTCVGLLLGTTAWYSNKRALTWKVKVYEVQPLIIPAVAVNAPHRRDRVWIIANAINNGSRGTKSGVTGASDSLPQVDRSQNSATGQSERTNSDGRDDGSDANAKGARQLTGMGLERLPLEKATKQRCQDCPDWNRSWQEVALATCNVSVDDGISRIMDGVAISQARWRKESLKAYGNAIVPQVAVEILKSIKSAMGGK